MRVTKIFATLLIILGLGVAVLPAQEVAAAPAKKPCTQMTFRKGAKNDPCVGHIQTMLNGAHSAGLKVDNDYGKLTRAAVINWQKEQKKTNAKMLVDGIVGKQTWGTLCEQKAKYTNTAKDAGCDNQIKPPACNTRTYSVRTNSGDPCVGHIQPLLNLATDHQLQVDSKFGSKTQAAVKDFQKTSKIKDDGIVGPKTWKALCAHKLPGQTSQDVYKMFAEKAGCKY